MLQVLGMEFYHHARIAPRRIALRIAHAVHHYLVRTAGSRHGGATRTHAEAVHSSATYLSDKGILSSWQILSPALLAVILYLIYHLAWMLQTHSYGYVFCLYLNAL